MPVSASEFVSYLTQLKAELDSIHLDQSVFDTAVMSRQIDALKQRFDNLNDDAEISLSDVLAELNEAMGAEIESQSAEVFGVDPDDASAVEDFNWKSRTASMVEKVDKLFNNTTFFARSLQTSWGDLNASDFFADKSINDWTKQAASGKKQVDVFRKEMIYSLQILDNAKNLGRLIGSSNELFEESPEQGAAIEEYALLAVKTAARASQLGVITWQQSLAKDNFKELSSLANILDNVEIQNTIERFLNSVSADPDTGELVRQPVGETDEDGNKLAYSDYISRLAELKKNLNTQLQTLRDETADLETHKSAIEADIQGLSSLLEIDPNDHGVRQHRTNLETQLAELDTQLTNKYVDVSEYERTLSYVSASVDNFANSETVASGAEAGYRLVSIGASVSGIVKNSLSGSDSATAYAGQSLSIVADLSDVAGAFSKLADATKGMKNFQTGAGAASGVVGVGPQVASFAQSIMDVENAPDEYKGYYIGEAIVHGANLAMGVTIGALTTYAAVAGTTVSKAVPVLGVVASLASAINPVQWAAFDQQKDHIDDVEAQADETSDAYETSAEYLAELLQDFYEIDVGFYAASTATSVVGGVASTALAASGVGAGVALLVAGVTAGLQATLEALKQTALNDAAEKMVNMIRDFEGGAAGFFDRSFEHSSEQELEQFFEQAQALIDSGYDSVSALGSVQMTSSDLELSALSGIGGELGQTQKHFSGFIEEDELGTASWDREEITIDTGGGVIQRGNPDEEATGSNNILMFITPLAAAGNENIDREEVSKNRYETTITIDDLTGWTIKDGGDNTTFDLRNIVTKARSMHGSAFKEVPVSIEANAGDDMFLVSDLTGRSKAADSGGILDGGEGRDSATYANLQHLNEGIQVSVNHSGNLQVKKVIDGDVMVYKDTIGQYEADRGKETEMVEYRYISADKLGYEITLFDEFRNIEMLAGSNLADSFNIADYNDAFLAAGLGGDDVFALRQGQAAIGGENDDVFHLVGDIDTVAETAYDLPEAVEIVGGDDDDTIVLANQWARKAFELGALYFVAEEALKQNPDLKSLLLPASIESEQGEDIAVAMVANMLSEDAWASTSFLTFSEIENVEWDFSIMHDVLFDAALESNVDLAEYDKAARAFLDRSTAGDYDGLITYDFSAQQQSYQYIRISQDGSTSNQWNHLVEIQALVDGVNVAAGKSSLAKITDGDTATNGCEGIGSSFVIDLQQLYALDAVNVMRYYGDGRTYHNTKVEVSQDGSHWLTVQDSSVDGEYAETAQSKYIEIDPLDLYAATDADGQIGYNIVGTENNDKIIGSGYADSLFGGDGDDVLSGDGGTNILTGADGADEFIFDFSNNFEDTVTLVDFSLTDTPDYADQALNDRFVFELGSFNFNDMNVFGGNVGLSFGYGQSRVTLENYYTEGYAGGSSIGAADQTFVFKSDAGDITYDYHEFSEFMYDVAAASSFKANGQISSAYEKDAHYFYLQAGQTYEIDLVGHGSSHHLSDPYFYGIYDQGGTFLGYKNDDGGSGRDTHIEFTPETGGLYRFEAGAFSSRTGNYELSVKVQGSSTNDLKLNSTFKGNIAQGGSDTDDFFAFFEKGKTYDINLYKDSSSSNTLTDSYFQGIYDPDDDFLGYKNDDGGSGLNSYTQFTAAETGIHKLVAGSFSTRSGDYALSIMEV